jgi:hypothetical protein
MPATTTALVPYSQHSAMPNGSRSPDSWPVTAA